MQQLKRQCGKKFRFLYICFVEPEDEIISMFDLCLF